MLCAQALAPKPYNNEVVSAYINLERQFAFVELKSIELVRICRVCFRDSFITVSGFIGVLGHAM